MLNFVKARTEIIAKEDWRIKRFKNLTMSAKFVFKILDYNGLLTQKEIADESGLPNRTVRYALNILDKEGLIEKRIHRDARQTLYGLKNHTSTADEVANFSCIPL
ncbi:MAG: winged helix-turn-helix domain-containing protein [Candidatus Methanoperedens sp.]|uniref:winged helix-turn-helix domain-containing protein n=1 Tax=Candidatus Methanoperedens sp. BLZ2 TaxID=2035255 RepID=UPI000BE43433|nr:winged helix-turn-helix domain-containing protein [Candidatus Methanoperedens sp. BLZ2]KAB2945641.1 MAG: winged helix-turn-helix transcriptional regulator [Candidatus Methanoperedens sp.]MBZ0177267.1 winged helix-turn-helix domain-containing protein [Candidatus Methanoperedens nitroreducens]MCX9076853.1 winged helix-turn-helix domain-containing protein [Candidatus Methanoperedens sp.]